MSTLAWACETGISGIPTQAWPRHPTSQHRIAKARGGQTPVFSRFFIDRPIFASVLSIVMTIAGVIAILVLPVAQYPEIAPPTIQVSCSYAGASAQVVADTVAAPIEQQVNGVEGMLYMSSQCTNDGGYNLTVTFELGTDLDMAQVLVQNRVSMAVPTLPDVVKQVGVTTKKKSPNIMLVVNLVSPDGRYDQLYLSNYATIRVKDELARINGVGDVGFPRPARLRHAGLAQPRRVDQPQHDRQRRRRRAARAERPGGGGPDRPGTHAPGPGFPVHPEHARAASRPRTVCPDHREDGRARKRHAPDRRGTDRTGRQKPGRQLHARRQTLDRSGGLSASRLQRPRYGRAGPREDGRTQTAVPRGPRLQDRLRHDPIHQRIDPRGLQDAVRGLCPRRAGRAGVPAELAIDVDPADRGAGVAGRNVRRHEAAGVQHQQYLVVRTGPGHRRGGRRRHRGRREYRAVDRAWPGPARGGL